MAKRSPGKRNEGRSKPRRIAVVTGTRAEFGLLRSTIDAIAARPALCLQLVVAGAHFVAGTDCDIKAAGYRIDAKVRMQKRGVIGRGADAAALGRGVSGFANAFGDLRPDVVLVLGDRIEAFAAASAASVAGIRVAHIHGGDRAEGVADEAMRHAITKLSHLHFPATKQSAKRIERMGEVPASIEVVGSPAVDGLLEVVAVSGGPEVIVLHHPAGRDMASEQHDMAAILSATRKHRRLVLEPNLDPGRDGVMQAIQQEREATGVEVVSHLPRERFLSLLKGAKVIVGNSSAGLIEAAVMKTACVNVGERQAGRERPGNVSDCAAGERGVVRAMRQAMAADLSRIRHPYGASGVGNRIAERLASRWVDSVPVRKRNVY